MMNVQANYRSNEIWPVMAAKMLPILSSLWRERERKGLWGLHFFFGWLHTWYKCIRGWLHCIQRRFKSDSRISFSWMNISAVLFVQQQTHGAVPQTKSNLGIMILGMFVHFAHSAPHYCFQKSNSSSLKIDTFCNILLLHIVSLWILMASWIDKSSLSRAVIFQTCSIFTWIKSSAL